MITVEKPGRIRHVKPSAEMLRAERIARETKAWTKSENDARAVRDGCTFDSDFGRKVVWYVETFCRFSKGEKTGELVKLSEWQIKDLILPMFSWRRENKTRRFREADIWIPKKNSKSTLSSFLGTYFLRFDGEPGARVYLIAAAKDQTGNVFEPAAALVNASPELKKMMQVIESTKRIITVDDRGFHCILEARSSDVATAEGWDASAWILDEIHVYKEKQRKVLEAFKRAGRARRQSYRIAISTAGEQRSGVGYEIYCLGKDIKADRVIQTQRFVYIREADETDDPGDPATWRKTNPMLGETFTEADLQADYDEAKRTPRTLADFNRYTNNIWGTSANPWIPIADWEQCRHDNERDGEWPDLSGRTCYGGLDLAQKTDLSVIALCWPPFGDDPYWRMEWRFWIPQDDIDHREIFDQVPYRSLAAESGIVFTEGAVTDQMRIRADIAAMQKDRRLQSVFYDPRFAELLAQELYNLDGVGVVKVQQWASNLTQWIDKVGDLVKGQQLRHRGNPVMHRQIQQAQVKHLTSGGMLLVKGEGKTNQWFRIDGCVAMVMAVGAALAAITGRRTITMEDVKQNPVVQLRRGGP